MEVSERLTSIVLVPGVEKSNLVPLCRLVPGFHLKTRLKKMRRVNRPETQSIFTFSRETVDLYDIARGLSQMPCFFGHAEFYCIAQHAVNLSMYQEMIGAHSTVQMAGLHHADYCAYLGSTDPEMRVAPCMKGWRDLRNHIQLQISLVFNLPWPAPFSIEHHHNVLNETEKQYLYFPLNRGAYAWAVPDENIAPEERLPIVPVDANRAWSLWLERHAELEAKCK